MAHRIHQWHIADTYRYPGNSGKLRVTWACTCGAFMATEGK